MIRKIFTASVATAAITLAGTAVAGPPAGRGGGPSDAGISARANSQGPMNASPMGIMHASPNSVLGGTGSATVRTTVGTDNDMDEAGSQPVTNPAVGTSQGPAHASVNGIAHASSRSVLASGAVPPTALPGLTQGLNVVNSSGTTLGTVSQVVYGTDGTIRLVVVTNTTTGQTYRLSPTTLSISGSTVTTTSM